MFLLAVCGLLLSTPAFAWAPATHLFFVKEVFQFSHLITPGVRELILQYLPDFLYGCVAADITIGKAYVDYLYNCHNFDVGFELLKRAKTPPGKAFVYGYLSHLAADTVSHNFFVPYQNVEHYEFSTFRHAYWEVRLDRYFVERVGRELKEVIHGPRTHEHDQLLDTALKDTIFSFRTNRVLFSGMMAIQRLKKWQHFVDGINRSAAQRFNPKHLSEYNALAVSAILHLFNEGKNSVVYRVDPTGLKVMDEAKRVRELLRKTKKEGVLTPVIHRAECDKFRQYVRETHFEKYLIKTRGFKPDIHMSFS